MVIYLRGPHLHLHPTGKWCRWGPQIEMSLLLLRSTPIVDLTAGKPRLTELPSSAPLAAALEALARDSPDGAVAVRRRGRPRDSAADDEGPAPSPSLFLGLLGPLDFVAFLAGAGAGDDAATAMRTTPVAEVVAAAGAPDPRVIREVDQGTRLIDAIEMMAQGARCLLVPKFSACSGISKRSSDLYGVKWLRNNENSSTSSVMDAGPSYSPTLCNNYCCLSQEDVVRFLIGRLNALAPLPLSPISSLRAINPNYSCIEASSPAIEAIRKIPHYDTPAVAVVDTNPDGSLKLVGDISSYKLQKCDYLATAWAMANLSAGEFVAVSNDENRTTPDFTLSSQIEEFGALASPRQMKFSSRSIGFFSNNASQMAVSTDRSVYRGRNATLTCKKTSSLAAVMAQMLSNRATHVWVTEADEVLIGVVGYRDILNAVAKNVTPAV